MKKLINTIIVLFILAVLSSVFYGVFFNTADTKEAYAPVQELPPEQLIDSNYWYNSYIQPLSPVAVPGTTMEYMFSAQLNNTLPPDTNDGVMRVGFRVENVPPEVRVEWSPEYHVPLSVVGERKFTRLRLYFPTGFPVQTFQMGIKSFQVAIVSVTINVYEADGEKKSEVKGVQK